MAGADRSSVKIRFGRGGAAHHGTPLALLVVPALAAGAIFEFGAPAGPTVPRGVLIVCALLWFVFGVKLRTRAWRMKDTPTSKVRAAAIGTCEFAGTAIAQQPAPGPASGVSSVWFHWELQELVRRRKSSEWVTREEREHRRPFALEDDTGTIRVDPAHAEFHGFRTFKHRVPGRNRRWRQLERRLEDRTTVYVLGPVRVEPGADRLEVGTAEPQEFLISDDSEKTVTTRMHSAAWLSLILALVALVGAATVKVTTDLDGEKGLTVTDERALAVQLVVLYLVVLALLWPVRAYNRLVITRNQAMKAWSSIEVQLQRRFDLLTNLVTVVRAYAQYEHETLVATAAVRAHGQLPDDGELTATASHDGAAHADATRLLALAEANPELHANENYEALATQLRATEDAIAFSRAFYNDAVTVMRDRKGTFPYLLVAGFVPWPSLELFEAGQPSTRAFVASSEP